ncbi:MAG: hypothetical protein SGARI_003897, partial [Bacillariaceae sp.]
MSSLQDFVSQHSEDDELYSDLPVDRAKPKENSGMFYASHDSGHNDQKEEEKEEEDLLGVSDEFLQGVMEYIQRRQDDSSEADAGEYLIVSVAVNGMNADALETMRQDTLQRCAHYNEVWNSNCSNHVDVYTQRAGDFSRISRILIERRKLQDEISRLKQLLREMKVEERVTMMFELVEEYRFLMYENQSLGGDELEDEAFISAAEASVSAANAFISEAAFISAAEVSISAANAINWCQHAVNKHLLDAISILKEGIKRHEQEAEAQYKSILNTLSNLVTF